MLGRRDMRTRVPMGGTSGSTTLNGEGFSEDGHSTLPGPDPDCICLRSAVRLRARGISQEGCAALPGKRKTLLLHPLMNENSSPRCRARRASLGNVSRSGGKTTKGGQKAKLRVQLVGQRDDLKQLIAGAERSRRIRISRTSGGPSMNALRRDGIRGRKLEMLYPESEQRPFVRRQCLKDRTGPVSAARAEIHEGLRRSLRPSFRRKIHRASAPTASAVRHAQAAAAFFRVDRRYVAVAAMKRRGRGSAPRSR